MDRVERLGAVSSTNTLLIERARAGELPGLWLVAEAQTAGHGRLGRTWVSEPGNLYTSHLFQPGGDVSRLGQLPLVVATALHDAVTEVLPPLVRSGLAIKWPNDVLFNGAKISGILLEGVTTPNGFMVVIGIGINCCHAPPAGATLYPTASLRALGHDVQPAALFDVLRRRLAARLVEWQSRGFETIRRDWLARAVGVGAQITVRLPGDVRDGIFVDLDATGRLVLQRPGGVLEAISAGDVFFSAK